MKLNKVIKKYGSWAVTEYGIEHVGRLEYFIGKEVIHNSQGFGRTWKDHMSEKRWVNQGDFNAAHDYAMRLWPKKSAA